MRRLILALALAVSLTACGAVVTPVDHECPGNPGWGIGSGCS
ncbi:MAG: hypothetical protein QOI93_3775 [Rhodospirillaceae bacterium]|jgi:hypothetical protein|nr:hypothetical protein [Rhodospirillaceae bacterium]